MTAAYQREINPTTEFDHLFPASDGKKHILHKNGGLKQTVNEMANIINEFSYQTQDLAKVIAKASGWNENHDKKKLARTIWQFVYHNIQYKLDTPGIEELRQPSRAWADRFTGVDCDCYALFIGCILTNLGVPFKLRVTKYKADWQHVYVAVPDKGDEYIIDCVLDKFNYEKPYGPDEDSHPSAKIDITIKPTKMSGLGIPIAMLSGVDEEENLNLTGEQADLENEPAQYLQGILAGEDFDEVNDSLDGILSGPDDEIELSSLPAATQKKWHDALYNHCRKTRNYIAKHPGSVAFNGGAENWLGMLDHCLENWHNPEAREKALAYLATEEERLSRKGVFGEADEEDLAGYGDDTIDGLDGKKKKKSKFFQKIGKGLKKAFKFTQKINPLMIAARNGFLLAAKLNFFGLARKLYPGFMSWEEAQKAGLKKDFWERKVKAANKFAKTWEDVLGGKKSKLVQSLKKGWKKKKHFNPKLKNKGKLHGLGFVELEGLGEPTSAIIGTSVAAAATIIATLSKVLKKEGANDLPPGDPEYPEDKVDVVTDAAKDLAQNAQDIAESSMEGIILHGIEMNSDLDDSLHPAFSGDELDEASIDGLGDKASRQAAREKRKKEKEAKKQARQTKKATNKAKKAAKPKKDKSGKTISETIEDAGAVLAPAGGMVSAANQLYKNKTGKSLIPTEIENFVAKPEQFFSDDEMKDIEKNDQLMKSKYETQEAGMGTVGKVLLGGAAISALAIAFSGGGKKKSPAPALSGAPRKHKNKKANKVKFVKLA